MAREQVIWIDADGGELNLNDWVSYFCTRDQKGVWAPPYTLQSTKTPLSEGSQFKSVVVGERGVDLSQKVKSTSRADLISKIRDLSRRMDPTRGEGQLKFINDGETRILVCRPEGIKNLTDKYTIAELVLSFTANDPFLYDDQSVTNLFETSGPLNTFFSATFLPLHLTRSVVYSLQTINNPGDAEVYPVWTITGPGLSIQLTNNRSGKAVSLGVLELIAGQELVIDTRSGMKTIRVDGENAFSYLTELSSLWSLLPGDNAIQIEMSGSSEQSSIEMEFTPRHQSK